MLTEHASTVHAVSWLSDNVVVSGCESGNLIAHDVRSGQNVWSLSLSAEAVAHFHKLSTAETSHRSICALTMLGDMTTLCIGSAGGHVTALDWRRQNLLFDAHLHTDDVRSVASLSNGDLVTTSYDSTAAIWRFNGVGSSLSIQQASTLRGGHTDKVLSCVTIPHTTDVITTGADGKVLLWSSSPK